jgi:hypothetical protein
MIGLIMFGSIINYLTRSTLSIAAPALMQDLHIYFEYHGREFSAAPYRSSLQADALNSFQERTR